MTVRPSIAVAPRATINRWPDDVDLLAQVGRNVCIYSGFGLAMPEHPGGMSGHGT